MDNVIGVIHVKDFLMAYHVGGDSSVLQLIAEKPLFIPQTIPLDRLLTTIHETRCDLVFLVDEYGGVAGIITLRDVFDELFNH